MKIKSFVFDEDKIFGVEILEMGEVVEKDIIEFMEKFEVIK